MFESYKRIIEKLIIPEYPEIESYQIDKDRRQAPDLEYNHYVVKYKISLRLSQKRANSLSTETRNFFNMMRTDKNDEISVVMYY